MGPLLDLVTSPRRLRRLPEWALPALAEEIRREVVATVTRTGGHLGPDLGVVELTIALHRVFESPDDAIVWDTGHQAYVHKLLTGRLRRSGGVSGYPSGFESPHTSTTAALSYVDDLAKAFELKQSDHAVIAVVGTGAMCWEALNNIGTARHRPVIVVLNDNGRSCSPAIGAVANHLTALRAGDGPPKLFEAFGLDYLGPVDGHDIAAVEQALREARRRRVPVVVHCVTVKGRGYAPAEDDEIDRLHTISPAAPEGGLAWTAVARPDSPNRVSSVSRAESRRA